MLDNIDNCLKALATPDEMDRIPRVDEADQDATVVARPIGVRRQGEVKGPAQVPAGEMPVLDPTTADPGDRLDPAFLELFIEEARDEILVIRKQLAIWKADTGNHEALRRMRRSYHTLKGSGRMVGASRIAEFSWVVENLMNRIIDGTLELNIEMTRMLTVSCAVLPELVEELEVGRKTKTNVAGLMALATRLAEPRPDEAEIEPIVDDEDVGEATVVTPQMDGVLEAAAREVARDVPEPEMDPVLRKIFVKETTGHLRIIRNYLQTCDAGAAPYPVTEALYRACHTLHGSAKMAGAMQGIKVAEPLDRLVRKLYDMGKGLDTGITSLQIIVDDEDVGEATVVTPQMDGVLEAAAREVARDVPEPEMDPVLRKIFVKETTGHLRIIRNYLQTCDAGAAPYPVTEALYRACHTLHGSAKMAGAMQGIKVAEPLDRLVRKLYDMGKGLDMAGIKVCQDVVVSFDRIIRHLDEDTGFFPNQLGLIERLHELEASLDAEQADADGAKEIEPWAEEEEVEFDGEIASIFSEEAAELLDTAETALSGLRDNATDQTALAELKRCLHTLKGGARMAGIPAMGNLSHETESLLDMIGQDQLCFSDPLAEILQASLDGLQDFRLRN